MRFFRILAFSAIASAIGHGCSLLQNSAPVTAQENPHGFFESAPGSPLYVGPMAGRPETGDVNGDGHKDIVVACGTCCGSRPDPKSGHIVVLLGDGKGGFNDAEGSPIKVSSSVRKVALGDFNSDGALDIAAAEHDGYEITILLNNGKGVFARREGDRIAAHAGPRPHTHEIAAADVNADGAIDLLTTNANDGCIAILLGNGKGVFSPAPGSPVAAGRHPYDAMIVQDVSGDAKADIVVPDIHGNAIVVLLGDARGGFRPAPGSPISVQARPGYVTAADANKDGHVDLFATHDDVGLVDVFLGDGKGGFMPAKGSPVSLAVAAWGLGTGDFNGDGNPDLLCGSAGGSRLGLLLGDGKGGFQETKAPELASGELPVYVAVADFNGDRRMDVVSGNYKSGDVSVFLAK